MKNLLFKLCRCDGVSGYEDSIIKMIYDEIYPFADSITLDRSSNLVAFKKGRKRPARKILFAAHLDEVGLVIKGITEDGFLKFDSIGVLPHILPGKAVRIGDGKISGIICSKPLHLKSAEEKNSAISLDDLYIDIGARSYEKALESGALGEYAAFDSEAYEMGKCIKAKALDDRVGCAALCEIIKMPLEYDTYFAFTSGEELGAKGALSLNCRLNPDITVVTECTTASDIPDMKEEKKVCVLGGGPVVPYMDSATVYDRALVQYAFSLAKENGIPVQTKRAVAGGTDARNFQRTSGASRVVGVSLACRYIHSPACVADKGDVVQFVQLLKLIANSIGEADV